MSKDMVTVTCYGKTEKMSRKDAMKFYLECMMMSEGAERDRYTNIYLGLISGETNVCDE